MLKNSFRITAKGYVLITILLLMTILLAGQVTRLLMPENQLIFALSKELKKEEASYLIDFEFDTQGDAVLYKDKYFKMESVLSRDTEKYHLQSDLYSQSLQLPSLEMFLTKEKIMVKTPFTQSFKVIKYNDISTLKDNQSLSITEIVNLLDLKDPDFLELLFSNLFKIKNIYEDNIMIKNNEVVFTITLDQAFDKLDDTVLLLSQQEEFIEHIKNRYSRLYDEFGQHPLWDETTINSMKLFNAMVAMDNDFYQSFHQSLEFLKKQLDHFDGESLLEISFTLKRHQIENILLEANLDYTKFDASENISLNIMTVDYKDIGLPAEEMTSLKPYIKKLYDSLKTEFN